MKIEINNLNKSFGEQKIFDDVSLSFPLKGIVIICGDSGSGKSTLLNIVSGQDLDYEGEVLIDNKNIKKFSNKELENFRISKFGFIYQNFNLLNLETVKSNILLPLDCSSFLSQDIKNRRVASVLEYVNLSNYENKTINKLSGGEMQRISIAREIIKSPSILLCDEPTGSLDEKNSEQIISLLKKISSEMLVIIVTHDKSFFKSANVIYKLSKKKIKCIKNNKVTKCKESFKLIGGHFKKRQTYVPLKFIFSHNIKKIKERKIRSFLTYSMLSFSLTGIGISLMLAFSLKDKINSSISSIIDRDLIVMKNKNNEASSFSNPYSAPKNEVDKISEKYKDLIKNTGVSYQVNFEDFFKDKNEFYIKNKTDKYVVNSLSARSINEYKLYEKSEDEIIYPYSIDILENDEIILGLNYVDMANICFTLKIQRNYSSLGEYIKTNNLFLILDVKNSNWQYDDEQIFSVKAVKESSDTCIFHSSPNWNEFVFEEKMRFPTNDDDKKVYPWEMYKIYYLDTYEDPKIFLDKVIRDYTLSDFIFERANNFNSPLLCKNSEICNVKRIYVYFADKNIVDMNALEKVLDTCTNIKNYYLTCDFSYQVFEESFLSGFKNNFYLSSDKEILEMISDYETKNETDKIVIPDNVINGNFLSNFNNGFKFSTVIKRVSLGRKTQNVNEILISKTLNEKLGFVYGKSIYVCTLKNQIQKNDFIENEFVIKKINVVGVVDEEKDFIYQDSDWPISFFRDLLGVSSFNLIPNQVVFEFENQIETEQTLNKLEKMFSSVKFANPNDSIVKSIDQTMKYTNVILFAFAFIASCISFLLLAMIIFLNIVENKSEIKCFEAIGLNEINIRKIYIFETLIYGLYAFFLSSIETVLFDIILSKAIGSIFKTSNGFSVNIFPIAILLFFAITLTSIVAFIVCKILIKKKKKII
ncbi:MAG TPA: hypothetical protein DDW20_00805 [Firmicutes bacterium]|nr:hypothetical protein [Bacillota bacterium]